MVLKIKNLNKNMQVIEPNFIEFDLTSHRWDLGISTSSKISGDTDNFGRDNSGHVNQWEKLYPWLYP